MTTLEEYTPQLTLELMSKSKIGAFWEQVLILGLNQSVLDRQGREKNL